MEHPTRHDPANPAACADRQPRQHIADEQHSGYPSYSCKSQGNAVDGQKGVFQGRLIRGRLLRALIGLSHDIAQIYQWNHPFACDPGQRSVPFLRDSQLD